MATIPAKPFRMAPLQRLTVKPIEDPVEQAALDEKFKRSAATAGGVTVGSEALQSAPTKFKARKRRR